jgi:hypothetical protein
MQVVQVEKDNTMFVPGYEHHTLQCDGCGEVERRMTFKKPWMQAMERLRSKQAELREREDIARATERLARFNRDWRRSCLAARAADSGSMST